MRRLPGTSTPLPSPCIVHALSPSSPEHEVEEPGFMVTCSAPIVASAPAPASHIRYCKMLKRLTHKCTCHNLQSQRLCNP